MRKVLTPALGVALVLVAALGALAQTRGAARNLDCVQVTGSAPFVGFGHNHVVTVRNGCDRTITCDVSTDADPAPVHPLRVEPGREESVTTRTGSPAFGFEPRAACQLEGASARRPGAGP